MISFDPLWKTLIDKKMSKREMTEKAGISKSTLVQLNHNQSVTLETIEKICTALECDISSVVEIKKS